MNAIETESAEEPIDLGAALALSFRPDWARGEQKPGEFEKLARKHGDGESERDRGRGDFRRGPGGNRDRTDRDRGRDRGDRPPRRDGDRGKRGAGPRSNSNRRDDRQSESRPQRQEPALDGWKLRFVPDGVGLDGLAREIKSSGKSVSLFDLAWLVLDRPERYSVEFSKPEAASGWVRCLADDSLWPDEASAIQHVLDSCLEKFYRVEEVEMDPPKGNFQCIAICGMSDEVLGPPNFHGYQTAVVRLHAAKFARVPFDLFKSRVRMVRDEEQVEAWKQSMSKVQRFVPIDGGEGSEPIQDREELRRHFRSMHAASAFEAVGESVLVSGVAAAVASCAEVRAATRRVWEDLKRFPLPLAHEVGRGLGARGIAVFKLPDNVTYASVARPKYLNREASPVSDSIGRMLGILEESAELGRAEQWQKLVASRDVPEDVAAKETAVAGDLLWLVREGHVLDMARGNLRIAPMPKKPKGDEGNG